MSIHKRIKKTCIRYIAIVFLPNGKQISKTFKRKIDAEMWETEQKQKLFAAPPSLKSKVIENSNKTLSLFCDDWLRDYAIQNKTASSVVRDRQIIKNQIEPYLGHYRLNELSQEMFEGWMYILKDKQYLSPKTCNNCLQLVRKILNDACRWKHLDTNEAKYVSPFKLQKRAPSFWTKHEVTRFIEYVKTRQSDMYPVFALALYAGLRRGEIRGLKWDCVDLDRKVLVIKRIYCEIEKKILDRTKGKRDRIVPINHPLFEMLVSQINLRQELVAPIFNWLHPRRVMERFCRESGVTNIRFHDLRHTFASNLVMHGKPLYEVQKLLGHSSVAMTEKYAHLSPSYLKGATDCLDFEPKSNSEVLKIAR